MTADESAGDALFRDPLSEGFARRVFRVAPGDELGLEPNRLPERANDEFLRDAGSYGDD